jgi:hypothetical protein
MKFDEAQRLGWISKYLGGWGCYGNHPDELSAELGALAAAQNRIEEDARRTEAAQKAAAAEAHKAWWDSRPKLFVRFGKCPANGKSRNYRDGVSEKGVSCYAAVIAEDKRIHIEASLTALLSGPGFVDRPAYAVRGEQIGRGSDGEPVLRVRGAKRLKGRAIVFPVIGEVVSK